MRLSIPVYVEQRPESQKQQREFVLRPLFFEGPETRGEQLSRVTAKMAQRLRSFIAPHAKEDCHQTLLRRFTYAPPLSDRLLKILIRLSKKSFECQFMFVELSALGK